MSIGGIVRVVAKGILKEADEIAAGGGKGVKPGGAGKTTKTGHAAGSYPAFPSQPGTPTDFLIGMKVRHKPASELSKKELIGFALENFERYDIRTILPALENTVLDTDDLVKLSTAKTSDIRTFARAKLKERGQGDVLDELFSQMLDNVKHPTDYDRFSDLFLERAGTREGAEHLVDFINGPKSNLCTQDQITNLSKNLAFRISEETKDHVFNLNTSLGIHSAVDGLIQNAHGTPYIIEILSFQGNNHWTKYCIHRLKHIGFPIEDKVRRALTEIAQDADHPLKASAAQALRSIPMRG